MKYIKPFLENSKTNSVVEELKYIFIELEDMGFDVDIKKTSGHKLLIISLENDTNDNLSLSDSFSTLARSYNYMKSEGYKFDTLSFRVHHPDGKKHNNNVDRLVLFNLNRLEFLKIKNDFSNNKEISYYEKYVNPYSDRGRINLLKLKLDQLTIVFKPNIT